ncbi:MAG TPA: hypothetical protein VFQ13_23400 [Anaerolineales bacterium]|nr:hypothetical protein [Anaerolineales bacterium]
MVSVLVYGVFVWRHGFYWDDLPMSWIRYELGPEAMRAYFSTSRPVWGALYQITTKLIPQVPLYWQVFAILWRWAGVVLLWVILRDLWPGRNQMALIASLFFLLYPGFNLQWVSYLTSHFYIVICIFFSSYLLMLWSLRKPERYWLLTIGAMVLSLLNLWMLEFFYFLELVRPFIIFYALYKTEAGQRFWTLAKRTFLYWLPYLFVFLLNVFYRAFVFTNVAYKNVLLSDLRADPLGTIVGLIRQVFLDLWLVSVQAWLQAFRFPNPSVDGPRTTILYAIIFLFVGMLVFLFLNMYVRDEKAGVNNASRWMIFIGLLAMLLGGGPYWLATLDLSLAFPASRFTMSFMLGVALLMAGVLELLPARLRIILASLLLAFAAGWQVMVSDAFRRDWQAQKDLFWQMTWRVPGLQPNTVVLMNEELSFYADNSISAPLNWIYMQGGGSEQIDYVLFYPTNRLNKALPSLQKDIPIQYDYIAGHFEGNTSDALAFYYDPPACLRLLEPDLDSNNRFILAESLMREASALTNPDRILRDGKAQMPSVYFPEPVPGWCYYFEKADLAGQFGDWETVTRLGDEAFAGSDYPNNPVERFVFIEGYAHAGDWEQSLKLSRESYKVSKSYVGPLLCRLWERIETETPPSAARSEALAEVQSMLACKP